jgi:hypothetical protein
MGIKSWPYRKVLKNNILLLRLPVSYHFSFAPIQLKSLETPYQKPRIRPLCVDQEVHMEHLVLPAQQVEPGFDINICAGGNGPVAQPGKWQLPSHRPDSSHTLAPKLPETADSHDSCLLANRAAIFELALCAARGGVSSSTAPLPLQPDLDMAVDSDHATRPFAALNNDLLPPIERIFSLPNAGPHPAASARIRVGPPALAAAPPMPAVWDPASRPASPEPIPARVAEPADVDPFGGDWPHW